MINKYNFETIELLHHVARDWTHDDEIHGQKPIDFYIVHVAFDALPDAQERDYFNSDPHEPLPRARAGGPGFARWLRSSFTRTRISSGS